VEGLDEEDVLGVEWWYVCSVNEFDFLGTAWSLNRNCD
jgi:hypothetical protein